MSKFIPLEEHTIILMKQHLILKKLNFQNNFIGQNSDFENKTSEKENGEYDVKENLKKNTIFVRSTKYGK